IMYAVIELKGSQILVEENDKITVNRIAEQKSKTLKVEKVLFGKKGSSYFLGDPYVKGSHVECEIIGDKRGKKTIAFKYRDRKSSQSKIGHRQDLTELKVKGIHFSEAKKTEAKEKKAESKG
ncbi:MAG: 50S ribosomal protein L21, partial [Candidatus Omnitrophica bacterium]|nr:50S ribosomal protein L21 [Candidatus Omnitrophota bacterium]